jgi:uncharacterized protein (TIGR03066 family)
VLIRNSVAARTQERYPHQKPTARRRRIDQPPARPGGVMRILHHFLTVCLLVVLAGLVSAQAKPPELILGRWQPTDSTTKDKVILEFLKEGKVKITVLDQKYDGSYRFTSDETLEMTVSVDMTTKTTKLTVTVKDNELVLTPPDGKAEKYTRLK